MLGEIKILIAKLAESKVRYCHWKSNCRLAECLNSGEDLDLLIPDESRSKFDEIVSDLDFKKVTRNHVGEVERIVHYLKPDLETGKCVHLHVYYKLITGGHYFKNYELPYMDSLLSDADELFDIHVPPKEVELFVLLIKKCIELASVQDRMFVRRESEDLKSEVEWLLAGANEGRLRELIICHLHGISYDEFFVIIEAMKKGKYDTKCIDMAKRVSECVDIYRRKSWFVANLYKLCVLMQRIVVKVFGTDGFRLCEGGAVVAVVGPDASGKSTIANEIQKHLGGKLLVKRCHVGTPPPTFLTYPLNVCARILRKKNLRGTDGDVKNNTKNPKHMRLLHVIQHLVLAYERKRLIKKIYKRAASGWVVVCDRYPPQNGGVDGARITASNMQGLKRLCVLVMEKIEKWLYADIRPADILLRLKLPVELAVERNRTRAKVGKKSDAYVVARYNMDGERCICGKSCRDVTTDRPLGEMMMDIKQYVWADI